MFKKIDITVEITKLLKKQMQVDTELEALRLLPNIDKKIEKQIKKLQHIKINNWKTLLSLEKKLNNH